MAKKKTVPAMDFFASLERVSDAEDKNVNLDVGKELPEQLKDDEDGKVNPCDEVTNVVTNTPIDVCKGPDVDGTADKINDKKIHVSQGLKEFQVAKGDRVENEITETADEMITKVSDTKDLNVSTKKPHQIADVPSNEDISIMEANETEQLDHGYDATALLETTEDIITGELDDHLESLSVEMFTIVNELTKVESVQTALENYIGLVSNRHHRGHDVDHDLAKAISIALESFDYKYFNNTVPSMESFISPLTRPKASIEVLDNLQAKAKEVSTVALDFIKKLIRIVVETYQRIRQNVSNQIERVNKIMKRVKENELPDEVRTIAIPRDLILGDTGESWVGVDPVQGVTVIRNLFDSIEKNGLRALKAALAGKTTDDKALALAKGMFGTATKINANGVRYASPVVPGNRVYTFGKDKAAVDFSILDAPGKPNYGITVELLVDKNVVMAQLKAVHNLLNHLNNIRGISKESTAEIIAQMTDKEATNVGKAYLTGTTEASNDLFKCVMIWITVLEKLVDSEIKETE
ncbi:internal head protein [Pseudomonas phage vB_Pae10145-KEN51]|uniref:PHIKZ162 n=8 Tax=root TaxID=1 RepID=Q8SD00_BPDPK|nr:internal head protein [Pseudomonas phage phiKZ]YP_009617497.1 internal head protein [Pseudomonas phage PA7]ANM44957.1 putative structural head protein [Pseudomonas phage KTN4]MBG7006688.1 hypothetical protein [Pseudomonas aeruginosa]QGK89829.1 hypothetical protein [Pseudomonas phage vB_PA32_GUMS]QJB22835.1 hypothetical protein fnug_192 [Pseudomonas phage fnug]QOV08047.1 structural protein [Pseudomonas phage vB_PaeM_kmuB]QYV99082.1 hypothetical protein [Pseudomonas phage T2P]QYV99355.1 hy